MNRPQKKMILDVRWRKRAEREIKRLSGRVFYPNKIDLKPLAVEIKGNTEYFSSWKDIYENFSRRLV